MSRGYTSVDANMAPAEPATAWPTGGNVSFVMAAICMWKRAKRIKREERVRNAFGKFSFLNFHHQEKMLTQAFYVTDKVYCWVGKLNSFCQLLLMRMIQVHNVTIGIWMSTWFALKTSWRHFHPCVGLRQCTWLQHKSRRKVKRALMSTCRKWKREMCEFFLKDCVKSQALVHICSWSSRKRVCITEPDEDPHPPYFPLKWKRYTTLSRPIPYEFGHARTPTLSLKFIRINNDKWALYIHPPLALFGQSTVWTLAVSLNHVHNCEYHLLDSISWFHRIVPYQTFNE